MKNLFVIIAIISTLLGCKKENIVPLNAQEKSDLLFLLEEEKLARDVYKYAYAKYGEEIFDNISKSEQSHMSSVSNLLEKYDIEESIDEDNLGVFINNDLQLIYNELTHLVDSSYNQALIVGATIEDLDIHDIDNFIVNSSHTDVLEVFQKLTCGSGNHLRSFANQLGSYSPTYISQQEYESIINSPNEQCGN